MSDLEEAQYLLDNTRGLIHHLVLGGLLTTSGEQRTQLANLCEEFERIGASHLTMRLQTLQSAIQAGDHAAAPALMKLQASVALFEKVLTKRALAPQLLAEVEE